VIGRSIYVILPPPGGNLVRSPNRQGRLVSSIRRKPVPFYCGKSKYLLWSVKSYITKLHMPIWMRRVLFMV